MALDARLLDQFGNAFRGAVDTVGGEALTETGRNYVSTLGTGGSVVIDLNGHATVIFDMRTAAFNGTVIFEAMTDGTNFDQIPAYDVAAEVFVMSVVVTTTLTKKYVLEAAGYKKVQARVSAFTSGTINVAGRASFADFMIVVKQIPSSLVVEIDGAANATATITLPAAGVGLFHYITNIQWYRHCTAALTGTGAFNITTTNLPGSMKWRIGNAIAVGQNLIDVDYKPVTPLKSSVANTNTTIVAAAAGAAVLCTGQCTYYVGA